MKGPEVRNGERLAEKFSALVCASPNPELNRLYKLDTSKLQVGVGEMSGDSYAEPSIRSDVTKM